MKLADGFCLKSGVEMSINHIKAQSLPSSTKNQWTSEPCFGNSKRYIEITLNTQPAFQSASWFLIWEIGVCFKTLEKSRSGNPEKKLGERKFEGLREKSNHLFRTIILISILGSNSDISPLHCLTSYYGYLLGYLLGSIQRFLPAAA